VEDDPGEKVHKAGVRGEQRRDHRALQYAAIMGSFVHIIHYGVKLISVQSNLQKLKMRFILFS
jgi:hypothetical protein